MVYFKKQLMLFVLLLLFSLEVSAFNVQRNVATGTISATISSVNTSNAFILFTAAVSDAIPDDWQFTPDFQSSTQIDFTRYDGASASANIAWQVIEDENINVQRGNSTLVVSNNSEDITINSVNLSESLSNSKKITKAVTELNPFIINGIAYLDNNKQVEFNTTIEFTNLNRNKIFNTSTGIGINKGGFVTIVYGFRNDSFQIRVVSKKYHILTHLF